MVLCVWHSSCKLLFFLIILIRKKNYLLWLSYIYTYTEFPIFFPGNLSTLTEFKKHQSHIFSILNFAFFQTICGCWVSKQICSVHIILAPASDSSCQGCTKLCRRLAPLQSCARKACSREAPLPSQGDPTDSPRRLPPHSSSQAAHHPAKTHGSHVQRPEAQQWIQVCLVSRWCWTRWGGQGEPVSVAGGAEVASNSPVGVQEQEKVSQEFGEDGE